MEIYRQIAEELDIQPWQSRAAIELIDEGNTIPFIARYRKEKTGTLNDEQLRNLHERLTYLRNLEDSKQKVLASIGEQGKLTADLRKKIEDTQTQVALDDLYRPYRPKRRTRASIAREHGLDGLAHYLLKEKTETPVLKEAGNYVSPDKGVGDTEAAVQGAMDILAEEISDRADIREWIRKTTRARGRLGAAVKDEKTRSVYENYYHFESPLNKVRGFQVLALNRGEKEKVLTVRVIFPEEEILRYLSWRLVRRNQETLPYLRKVAEDAWKRLLSPSIEREIRNELTEKAEDGAIDVFGKNLTQLLMQPPVTGQVVLGWDPAFRTGCKLAVVDETGKVLDTAVIYPTAPTTPAKIEAAKKKLKEFVDRYHVTLISCGNGTASRESEKIIAEFIKEIPQDVSYVITNEAGASVYSASKLASEEFPNFDVGQRSAASIARRVQDPLAELVKIDPKSIGVGQYQHDMNQKKLGEALEGVVEDCVNRVGVDLNTASAVLLSYVSGITKTLAKNIVAYREKNGSFDNRKELLHVPKLGPKAFEQCAGFLRIRDGSEVLDNTAVHPESYDAARKLLEILKITPEDLRKGPVTVHVQNRKELADRIGVGEPTLKDIIEEITHPGRDPRKDLPPVVLRKDVLDIKDLKVGMVLKGTVRNIVDFGAFVDIGVHEDGLVHISHMAKGFVKNPLDVVRVGDIVDVKVISVDLDKKRIGLSMVL